MSKFKTKKSWDNRGVSEVVGTILILAITVVLFSSIMVFVMNMPVPNNKPIADFRASLDINSTSGVATLSVLHNGGETLFDYATDILVVRLPTATEDRHTIHYSIGDNITEPASNIVWQIGQVWEMNLNKEFTAPYTITSSSQLEVDIVDVESNAMIWSSLVGAGAGDNSPVILQRWVDADTSTLNPDPIRSSDKDNWVFYVRASDPDGDLPNAGVWLNASSIENSSHMLGVASGDLWTFTFVPSLNASRLDGKPLIIHAVGSTGKSAVETYVISVEQPDISNTNYNTNITFNGTEPTGEAGLPSYLKWFDADQGYVVLGADLKSGTPPMKPNLVDPRTSFKQGEYVFVRVGSFKLQNIFAKNNLSLVNHQSGTTTYPCDNATPFYRIAQSGGVFVYEAKFSSAALLGGYDMTIGLQSTVTSGSNLIAFNAIVNLIVQPASGPSLVLPEIRLNGTNPLNRSAISLGTFENPFDLSDASKSIIWVHLIFLDAGAGSSLTIGNVEMKDLRDRTILSGVPPSSINQNSTFGKIYSNMTYDYVFKIDLRLRNGYNLVPGTASYSLTISNAFDVNEGVYTMSVPIWVKSATDLKNFVVATSGYGGVGNFNNYYYLFQMENNKFFTTRTLESAASVPSAGWSDVQIYRSIYFDVDGDGDRDIIASMKTPAGYGWGVYVNRMNEYGVWEPKSFYLDPDGSKITALAYGDVNLDGAIDFVTANALGKLYLYNNTFPIITPVLLRSYLGGVLYPDMQSVIGKFVLEMQLADMTADGKPDLIMLVNLKSGNALHERNNIVAPGNDQSSGQILIYDISTGRAIKQLNIDTDGTVFDFEAADINKDGYLDYAVSSGTYGIVWYEAVPDPGTYLAVQDFAGSFIPATNVTGTFADTQSSGGGFETIQENGARAEHIWKMDASATGNNPTLRVDARVSSGCTEAFYFYNSKSSSGPWTFMFYVPSNSATQSGFVTFTHDLGASISGALYIRVTDSASAVGGMNSIFIDLIKITTTKSIKFNSGGSYTHTLRSSTDPFSLTYPAIGVGNFNGDNVLDIAVGKDGNISVFNGNDGKFIKWISMADIRVTGDTFVAKDVNGDKLADIVFVLQYLETIPSNDYYSYSIVYEWINTASGTQGTVIPVKNLSENYGPSASGNNQNYGPQYYGAINCITVENPYG